MSVANWLNSAWMLKCRPEAFAFRKATATVRETQLAGLRRIVAKNASSSFGRRHGFASIAGVRDFQNRVPLANYDDFAPLVERIASGEQGVLTAEPVRLLSPTGGTSAGEKLIPYTVSLRREFQRAIAAWIADLFANRPAVRRGRAYWSISPAFGPRRTTQGKIPIGFDHDAEYLGRAERLAIERLLVAPRAIASLTEIKNFRYVTLLSLVRAADLALISIWSPTFLTAILRPFAEWGERLASDIRRGEPSLPVAERLASSNANGLRFRPDPRRAVALETVLNEGVSNSERNRRLWPMLALISCWADASASLAVPELLAEFPDVQIQPKGLLATEGCVSFPLVGRPGAALALRSHFFEFRSADDATGESESAPCLLADEIQLGGRYVVMLTTGGGLYRYRLGDLIEVVGFEKSCPLIRFLGRADRTSDLVGEKLGEAHVRRAIDRALVAAELAARFAMLVPVAGAPPRYRLYLQADSAIFEFDSLRAELESGLNENPHYRYAVGVGQLGAVEVSPLDPSGPPAWTVFERVCLGRGQRPGDIKPVALDAWTGWPTAFSASDVPIA